MSAFALASFMFFLSGCGMNSLGGGNPGSSDSDNDPTNEPPAEPVLSDQAVPDFSLIDVNASSRRHGESVSPRDYLGKVSAWYFGHST